MFTHGLIDMLKIGFKVTGGRERDTPRRWQQTASCASIRV